MRTRPYADRGHSAVTGDMVEGMGVYEGEEYTLEEVFDMDPKRCEWDCCVQDGTAEGCITSWHHAY